MHERVNPSGRFRSPGSGTIIAAALVGAALGFLPPALAGESEDRARAFARNMLGGDFKPDGQPMSPEMRTAMTVERVEEIRASLIDQNGPLESVGPAWEEDAVGGYRRFRVPATFAMATFDLRVVLSADDKISGVFIVPHVEPPAEEGSAPVAEVEVIIGDAERGLPGTLSLPPGKGPFAGVVLVHGSGPQDRDETVGPNKPFRDIAWGLAQRGVAVLRYDKRSFARPADLVALGDGLTVHEEVIDDARQGLAFLRSREEIDTKRVMVLGHSLGGQLAPRIAASNPQPAGVIIMAGSTLPLPEKMLQQVNYIARLDGQVSPEEKARIKELSAEVRKLRAALKPGAAAVDGTILGAPVGYYRDLEAQDAATAAAALGLPTLVLHGGRDYQVTGEDLAGWKKALDGKTFACFLTYPELDHLFHEGSGPSRPENYSAKAPVSPRALDDIAGWIKERNCRP